MKTKKFVALKGQPIHKGHCYLIERMINIANPDDLLMIGIVNPYPFEKMDLSRNRKPENFSIKNNPLTYFERYLLLNKFINYIGKPEILILPYFVATVFDLKQMYNYFDIKKNTTELISNKDEFEIGKEKELNNIGVRTLFLDPVLNNENFPISAKEIRNKIINNEDVKEYFNDEIFKWMNRLDLFRKIRERCLSPENTF